MGDSPRWSTTIISYNFLAIGRITIEQIYSFGILSLQTSMLSTRKIEQTSKLLFHFWFISPYIFNCFNPQI